MENKTVQKIEKSNVDAANATTIKKKISLKKESLELIEKEGKEFQNLPSKSVYKGIDNLSSKDQKIKRGKIRRTLDRYVSIILGKDKSDAERIQGIENFLEFYKENWKITDFKLENFSNKKNEQDLKDYKNLLDVVRRSLE
jgi:CRISPR/Cas system-associated endonuclease/helicase Cas3